MMIVRYNSIFRGLYKERVFSITVAAQDRDYCIRATGFQEEISSAMDGALGAKNTIVPILCSNSD